MIRNYFKIAWRNLGKHGTYSVINMLGLFFGLTFSLLIGAYVWGELQVNQNLKNANRQVILTSDWKQPNMGIDFTTVSPLAKRLKEAYPSLVENYFRWDGVTSIVSTGDKKFREGLLIGDASLVAMYGFELLYGNEKEILSNPYAVVITKEKALKYFGKTDVIGETIKIQNFSKENANFIIEGVLESISKNSVTQINSDDRNDIFISSKALPYFDRTAFENWENIYIPSYIELKEGVTLKDLELPIQQLIAQNTSERIQQNLTVNPVFLTDFYLQQDNGLIKRMINTMVFIGVFILLMVIINFVNISISTAGTRMKEIGIRKVIGGIRLQLLMQFLIESFILVAGAMVLSTGAFYAISPWFNDLFGTEIPLLTSLPTSIIGTLVCLTFLISLLAGIYPAFVLSSLKPIDSLKGKLRIKKGNVWVRKGLVGVQFSIALIVLISASIITKQVDYFFGKELGYDKEYVLSAQVPRDWSLEGVQKMKTIRNEFEKLPQVKAATLSYEIPNGNFGMQQSFHKVGAAISEAISMKSLSIDDQYLTTYKIDLVAGDALNTFNQNDSTSVIINQKAALAFGWKNPEEAIGKQIKIGNQSTHYTVKGVTDDFHFGSMHQKIQPLALFDVRATSVYRYLSFRMHSNDIEASLLAVQLKWNQLLPSAPFEYNFMDETLQRLYASEIQLKNAIYNGSLLSLLIVFLGIFGLVSLNIHNRIREIGIRKVLGASAATIISLFLKEFLIIITIAGILAFPLAYYIMSDWLQNYAYTIAISFEPFMYAILGLSLLLMVLIALLTWKSASVNPIKSLRTE